MNKTYKVGHDRLPPFAAEETMSFIVNGRQLVKIQTLTSMVFIPWGGVIEFDGNQHIKVVSL